MMETTGGRTFGLLATLAIIQYALPPAFASDPPAPQTWKDQEAWSQFTDTEQTDGFRMRHPHPEAPKKQDHATVAPLLHPEMSSGTAGSFSVPGYVMMPAQQAAPVPSQHEETTIIPLVRPSGISPYFGGAWQNGYGSFAPGLPVRHFGGLPSLWNGGYYPQGPQVVGFRKETRFVQTGPSKSSGNYYGPSSADPSSSGSYYASPSGTPTAMPIIQQEPAQKDYWGPNGNPLPTDGEKSGGAQ